MDEEKRQRVESELRVLLGQFQYTGAHPIYRLPSAAEIEGLREVHGDEAGKALLLEGLKQRQAGIDAMNADPLNHGYDLPWWKDAWELQKRYRVVCVLGGNDSTKTWFLVKTGVRYLVAHKGGEWIFGHNTERSSQIIQQKVVYQFLPPEWRDVGKAGAHVDVTYRSGKGFKENMFVLPNGARGYHFFWKQDAGDLAGYKVNGMSGDELITLAHLEEMEAQGLGKGGQIVLGFTPVQGYSPVVASLLHGATVLQTRPARFLTGKNFSDRPDVPVGHMPYVMQCRKPDACVLFAYTEWSPFRKGGDEELEAWAAGRSKMQVMIRLYGWVDRAQGKAIPKFGRINIVGRNREHGWNGVGVVPARPWEGRRDFNTEGTEGTEKRISDLKFQISKEDRLKPGLRTGREDGRRSATALYPQLAGAGTNRVVIDPGMGAKNWVIKWYRVLEKPEWHFVYREWPPKSTHGEWALPTQAIGDGQHRMRYDGYPGPAQRTDWQPGIKSYKRIILEAEGWVWDEERGLWIGDEAEPIYERFIDPRGGGSEVPSLEDEGSSIISMLEDEQRDEKGRLVGPSLVFYQAPGGGRAISNQQSLEKLNDWFDYNTDQEANALNCPRMYVVDWCEQTIYAWAEYTGIDGEKGALKDILDPDWYYVKTEPGYVDEERGLCVVGAGEGEEDE